MILYFVLAVYAFVTRIWVAEDAYISFRYILSMTAGHGLVFNQGERVEGFTHPYWLFLVSCLHFIGIHFHKGSIILGFFFSLFGYLLLFYDKIKKGNTIYLLPAMLVCHEGFRDFSTSGLEFSFTFFMLSLLLTRTYGKELDSPFLIGALSSILYHTRPEMGLLLPFYFLWRIYEKRELDWNWIFRFSTSVFLFAGIYHIFRFIYFGDIFPNTFYAKSGGKSRYYDGLKYLYHFIFYSKFVLVSTVIVISLVVKDIYLNRNNNSLKSDKIRSAIHLLPLRELLLTILIAHYIIRVGGDFMGFRLLLPYFVIFIFCMDNFFNEYYKLYFPSKNITILNIVLLLFSIGLIIEKSNYPLVDKTGIVNERKAYTKGYYNNLSEIFNGIQYDWYYKGIEFKKLQECLGANEFVITNSITEANCNEKGFGLGYFAVGAGANVSLIDELGLTDREVAKSGKKSTHERVGHERSISLEQVIEKKAIFCSMEDAKYDSIMKTRYGVLLRIDKDFLSTFSKEEYKQKVSALKKLKAELIISNIESDKKLLARLKRLEIVFKQEIDLIPDESSVDVGSTKEACWKE